MSIPIGTKMLTKPPKQKSKTHLKNHTFKKKKNLHETLLNSTMNNDLCISQTYSKDNVKTSRLHDTHIVMNKGEINTGESSGGFKGGFGGFSPPSPVEYVKHIY